MGDVLETFAALLTANPSVRFMIDVKTSVHNVQFDSST